MRSAKHILRIGCCVAAVVSLVRLASQPSFAQDRSAVGDAGSEATMPISVQSARSAKPNAPAAPKSLHLAPARQGRLGAAPAPGAKIIGRNAIGQPVTQANGATRPAADSFGRATVHPPVAMGSAGRPSLNAGSEQGRLAVPNANAPILNRGSIGGATMNRSGKVMSPLGGQAKPVAGINGTTIRPKH